MTSNVINAKNARKRLKPEIIEKGIFEKGLKHRGLKCK